VTVPVPDPPPAPSIAEVFNGLVPRPVIKSAGQWQEWLGEHNGREAWAGEEKVPETNFMARAKPGEVTGGWVKSAAKRDGLDVWERVS
jgi:hypothetical protein